MLVAACGEICN